MDSHLDAAQQAVLETLLVVDPKTQKSPFARLCANPGRPTHKNLSALIDRYHWLQTLPNPTTALQSVVDLKTSQWANEARRLNQLELREHVPTGLFRVTWHVWSSMWNIFEVLYIKSTHVQWDSFRVTLLLF